MSHLDAPTISQGWKLYQRSPRGICKSFAEYQRRFGKDFPATVTLDEPEQPAQQVVMEGVSQLMQDQHGNVYALRDGQLICLSDRLSMARLETVANDSTPATQPATGRESRWSKNAIVRFGGTVEVGERFTYPKTGSVWQIVSLRVKGKPNHVLARKVS